MATHQRRSLARIDGNDLLRLAELAADVEAGLFARHPRGAGRYGRLVCRALCQGAALHYLDGTNGVKDFDVWSFYAERGDGPFPYRWRGTADYGPSKFGRYPDDPPSFTGRRVDLLGRSLDVPLDAEPAKVLRDYLSAARTRSAKELGRVGGPLCSGPPLSEPCLKLVASHGSSSPRGRAGSASAVRARWPVVWVAAVAVGVYEAVGGPAAVTCGAGLEGQCRAQGCVPGFRLAGGVRAAGVE